MIYQPETVEEALVSIHDLYTRGYRLRAVSKGGIQNKVEVKLTFSYDGSKPAVFLMVPIKEGVKSPFSVLPLDKTEEVTPSHP